jgi:hypothetical protein
LRIFNSRGRKLEDAKRDRLFDSDLGRRREVAKSRHI